MTLARKPRHLRASLSRGATLTRIKYGVPGTQDQEMEALLTDSGSYRIISDIKPEPLPAEWSVEKGEPRAQAKRIS